MKRVNDTLFHVGKYYFNKENLAVFALEPLYRKVVEQLATKQKTSVRHQAIVEELFKSGLLTSRQELLTKQVCFSPVYSGFRIVLGEICNLHCSHCFVLNRQHVPKIMTWPLLQSILEQTFVYGYNRQIKYHFFGGEPMMMRKRLHDAVKFIEDAVFKGKLQQPILTLTTNGTVITEEDITFFAKHKIAVGVSVDGEKKENDAIRGIGTFDKIIHTFTQLQQAGLDPWFLITPTIKTVDKLPEFAESMVKQYNLKSLTINTPFDGSTIGWDIDGVILADKILECYRRLSHCGVTIENAAGPVLYALGSRLKRMYPCSIVGNEVMASVSVDGRVSYCAQYWGEDLFPGHFSEIKNLSWSYERPETCLNCFAENLCGGPCPINYVKTGKMDNRKCSFYRRLLTKFLLNPSDYLSKEQVSEQ